MEMEHGGAGQFRRLLRMGHALAFLGLALQLVGIAWDGVLHYLDATLAARESVFTLTNPSHLLLAAGLALTCCGVGAVLLASGWPDARLRREALSATTVLALLGVGVGVVAVWTGGLGSLASDHHDAPVNFARAPEVQEVLEQEGTRAAISRLIRLMEEDPGLKIDAHQIIHDIGRASFALDGDISQTFEQCTQDFQSGCYHGAVEAYSAATGSFTRADVRSFCAFAKSTPGSSDIVRFECLHGLGHGMTSHFGHNLIESLYHCDYLTDHWERRACYGGVFMENIIFWSAPPEGDTGHHHSDGEHRAFVKAGDFHYPCSVLGERYVNACYKMQTSIILRLNDFDFSAAFQECGAAPPAHRLACYESMGRDISSYTIQDEDEALRLCRLGTRVYEPGCYVGVARNMTAISWDPAAAMSFCARTPAHAQRSCFRGIGYDIAIISSSAQERVAACSQAELPSYVEACRRGLRMRIKNDAPGGVAVAPL